MATDNLPFPGGVVSLYGDPALWRTIPENGRRLVEDGFGDAANRSGLCRLHDNAGALALDMHVAWHLAAEAAALHGLELSLPQHTRNASLQPCDSKRAAPCRAAGGPVCSGRAGSVHHRILRPFAA
ncbi:MAG: hypothetical protein IOC71_13515, partial [Rhodobacter sp.]|nr:hypothetical protein [Rhodobacter sp.]